MGARKGEEVAVSAPATATTPRTISGECLKCSRKIKPERDEGRANTGDGRVANDHGSKVGRGMPRENANFFVRILPDARQTRIESSHRTAMKLQMLISFTRAGYDVLVKGAPWLQSPLLLAVRLYWGWSFFQTGLGKLHNLEQTTAFFTDLGLPMPAVNATLAGATECVGGLLLLAGLASRLTAIPLIFTMIVAYFTADLEAVKNIFSEPDKFFAADPFLFLFAALLVLVFGPGAFSLDHLLGPKLRALTGQQDAAAERPEKTSVSGNARAIAH
jgi:putative oxidoreductase